MRRYFLAMAALALLSLVPADGLASPVPVTLTVTPSNFRLIVNALDGSASAATTISGTQQIALYDSGSLATAIELDGGAISMSDVSLRLNFEALGFMNLRFMDFHFGGLESRDSPIPLQYLGGEFNYSFNPSGNSYIETRIPIDSGLLTYSGSGVIASLLGSGTLDYSREIVELRLPRYGQLGTITQTLQLGPGGQPFYQIVMVAPVSAISAIGDGPLGVYFTAAGTITATGAYLVPEPSTKFLLGLSVAFLIPFWRRTYRARTADGDASTSSNDHTTTIA